MIWVAGESLVDLLPDGPVPGGGPANTAIALARLGIPVCFVGGISTDEYGKLLRTNLERNDVDLSYVLESDLPTAVAEVTLASDGSAWYHFSLTNTATFSFAPEKLPTQSPQVLHIGSLATVVEPAASQLFQWASSLKTQIVFDPNVRPAVLADSQRYRESVEDWAKISTVIKLSSDDLAFLYPEQSALEALGNLMHPGCALIVLTQGENGVIGITPNETIVVPGIPVSVIDTIGAGDTVGAILVEAIAQGIPLVGVDLERTLKRAVRAAAITCSRAGCNPPTADELR